MKGLVLTKVCSVSVKHGQADKLLGDLGPSSNEETKAIAALKDSPGSFFAVTLCEDTLLCNSGSHNFLKIHVRTLLKYVDRGTMAHNLLVDAVSLNVAIAPS